jgi:hypothetical protein
MKIQLVPELLLQACLPPVAAVRLTLTNTDGLSQSYDLDYDEALALSTYLTRTQLQRVDPEEKK